MKKIILLAIIVLFLSSCGNSVYKEQMELGNNYLEDEKYDEAITAFTVALEEKPNDEDALNALEKAKGKIEEIEREKEELRKQEEEKRKEEEKEKVRKEEQKAAALEMLNNDIEKMIELGKGLVVAIEPYLPNDWEVTNVYVSDDWYLLSETDKEYIADSLASMYEKIIVSSGVTSYTDVYFRDNKNDRIVAEPKAFGGYKIK